MLRHYHFPVIIICYGVYLNKTIFVLILSVTQFRLTSTHFMYIKFKTGMKIKNLAAIFMCFFSSFFPKKHDFVDTNYILDYLSSKLRSTPFKIF